MEQPGNNTRHLGPTEVMRLRGQIEDELAYIPRHEKYRKGRALELAVQHGAIGLTRDKLQHMIDLELIRPVREKRGARVLFAFERNDIRDIILVQMLREANRKTGDTRMSYARIASLLRDLAEDQRADEPKEGSSQPDIGVPTQVERGLVYLRSRMLGMCLTWLFDGRTPVGAVVVVRRRLFDFQQASPGIASYEYALRDFPAVDNHLGDIRPDDLVCHVTREGELLSLEIHDLIQFHKRRWHHWSVAHGSPRRQFDLVVGVPPTSAVGEGVDGPVDSGTALLFALLLETCFLEVDRDALGQFDSLTGSDSQDLTTPLAAILHMLPDISPLWQYCAVLAPDLRNTNRLRLVATSSHFPPELRRELSIEPGQLLSGWAYQYGYPVVVSRTIGSSDPRVSHQDEEQATAAIAIPTRANDIPNGALYVGTRAPLHDHSLAFSDAEIRLLRMVADILGEIIERNHIRVHGERMALEVIREPPRHNRPWSEYKDAITAAVSQMLDSQRRFTTRDNLHIMAVRLEGYNTLFNDNPVVAQWVANHIRDVAHRFYLKHYHDTPTFFDRNELNPSEFVCLIPHISLADEQDRGYRGMLRQLLSSLKIPFRVHEPVHIQCYVWSMPFRLIGLRQRVEQQSLQDAVRQLVKETEEALVILPFIEKGHEYESQGSYPQALDQYLKAHTLVPENLYIMRHIAKTLTSMGD